jgi:hypothetical protein
VVHVNVAVRAIAEGELIAVIVEIATVWDGWRRSVQLRDIF